MKKKPNDKKVIWMLLFVLAAFTILEIALYIGTGHFVICSRYGTGCGNVNLNGFLAYILFFTGIVWLFNFKQISKAIAKFEAKNMGSVYGTFATRMKWEEPKTLQSIGYQVGTIGVGVALLMVAYILAFGTINLG